VYPEGYTGTSKDSESETSNNSEFVEEEVISDSASNELDEDSDKESDTKN
jgi:hypothetical protein